MFVLGAKVINDIKFDKKITLGGYFDCKLWLIVVERGILLTQLKFWWCPKSSMWLGIALDFPFEWIVHA